MPIIRRSATTTTQKPGICQSPKGSHMSARQQAEMDKKRIKAGKERVEIILKYGLNKI